MKFATQHKQITINDGIRDRKYWVHRDGKNVWATESSKNATVFSHEFPYTSRAKSWMENPDLRVK